MEKTSALRFILRPTAVPQVQRYTQNETPWEQNGVVFPGLQMFLLEVNA